MSPAEEAGRQSPATTRVLILAGGMGTRLRPYTVVLPKPLVPIGDRPVLEIIIRQLHRDGFRRITIVTGYLAELIEAFFRDGSAYDVEIDYFREHEPLGTVGALALIDGLDEDFLVMNGDTLTDLSYRAVLDDHLASGAAATIATIRREVKIDLGVLRFSDSEDRDRLTGYDEKPVIEYDASMGVYCFSPRVLPKIEPNVRLDFPDLVLRLVGDGETVRAWRSSDYWLDIGRHEDYEAALAEFEENRSRLIPQD
jgi:NDP-mannose synthase